VPRLLREELGKQPPSWSNVAFLLERWQGALEPLVREALFAALRGGDRVGALKAFASVQDPTVVADLFRLLDEPGLSRAVRDVALQALATVPSGDPGEVVRGLEARMTGNRSDDLKLLQFVAIRGGAEAARALVEYIDRLEDRNGLPNLAHFRMNFAKDPAATEVLLDALQRAQSDLAISAYVQMAGQPGAEAFTDALIALDDPSRSSAIRREAVQAIGRLGTARAVDYLLAVSVEASASGADALRALGGMSGATEDGKGRLLEVLRSGSAPAHVELEVIRALGTVRYEPAREVLAESLGDRDAAVAGLAVRALGELGESARPHVKDMTALFEKGDDELRRQVVVALGGVGGPEARAELERLAADTTLSEGLQRTIRHQLVRLERDERDAAREG
jgi:HEAT repeat protein